MEVQPHVTPVPSPRETAPAAARPIHLRVQGITKRFGAFTALDDVSLEVESGRLVCFLGPSGCGKTTLLRVIAGLEMQDTGNVEIGGRDVTRLPPRNATSASSSSPTPCSPT